MSDTKGVYINTIYALLIISLLLFIENLSSVGQLASASLSNATVTTTNTSSGLANATTATGAVSENLTSTLGNATIALENATAVATNATAAAANATRLAEQAGANATLVLTNVSQTAAELALLAEQVRANLTRFSLAEQLGAFSDTISISVVAIASVIAIPLIINLFLRYHQGKETSINQLYRMLVAIGVIFVVILIVAYLNSLIWFNTAQGPSNVVESLLETQQNFLTILGTAFASLVAFYFGTRGTQNSNAERTASITGRPLEVIDINPINGTAGVQVDSPVTATFSTSIRSSTINSNTFSVKDANGNPVQGQITLTDDNTTIRFNPVPHFNRNSRYTVTIRKGIMDTSGASLVADMEWHFTTIV
ncbi:MAG: Ig-like domain-containing protein [Thermoproteota archaeon]|nr:Ig-like domain-containing protein [Thermoproteota archaeon]MDQ4067777.1 Ig-like domain-containing protein [Thermoproteota archaeon]